MYTHLQKKQEKADGENYTRESSSATEFVLPS